MNTTYFPEKIRTACERLKNRRGPKSVGRGKYVSPERVTLLIVFYQSPQLISADELWRRAKQECISISRQTTRSFLNQMVASGLAFESQGMYGDALDLEAKRAAVEALQRVPSQLDNRPYIVFRR